MHSFHSIMYHCCKLTEPGQKAKASGQTRCGQAGGSSLVYRSAALTDQGWVHCVGVSSGYKLTRITLSSMCFGWTDKMKHISYLLIFMLVLVVTSDDQNEEETGRIFPLLPPYQGVDFLQNWRTLATVQNAIFTLLKSTITVSLDV